MHDLAGGVILSIRDVSGTLIGILLGGLFFALACAEAKAWKVERVDVLTWIAGREMWVSTSALCAITASLVLMFGDFSLPAHFFSGVALAFVTILVALTVLFAIMRESSSPTTSLLICVLFVQAVVVFISPFVALWFVIRQIMSVVVGTGLR